MVYPMALRCFLRTLTKEPIWVTFKLAFTITRYVDFGPKNSYLKDEERSFNSTSGLLAHRMRAYFHLVMIPPQQRKTELVERLPQVEHTQLLRDFYT